jgi:hypothetical protein
VGARRKMKKRKQRSFKEKMFDKLGSNRIPIAGFVFVLLFGLIGVHYLFASHAASTGVELQLGSDRSLCMDNVGNRSGARNPIVIWSCNKSDSAQQFTLASVGNNRFLVKTSRGTCVDDTGDGVGSSGHRVYVMTYSCNSSDHAQVWMWQNSQLQNAYNKGCINDPGYSKSNGTQLIVYSCSPRTGNALWYEASVSSGGGSSASGSTTGAKIISAAKKWNGVWYRYGAGHESYTTFHKGCPTVKNVYNCEVDCSGLVSMATDLALGKNYSWYVDGNGVMQGSGASHWHSISLSSAKPGDIVTASDHVEFVDTGYGVYPHIGTFGAHSTGQRDGYQSPGHTFHYYKAYRYE